MLLELPQIRLTASYTSSCRLLWSGKRYLEPFGNRLGVHFPDRIRKLHDYTGKVRQPGCVHNPHAIVSESCWMMRISPMAP